MREAEPLLQGQLQCIPGDFVQRLHLLTSAPGRAAFKSPFLQKLPLATPNPPIISRAPYII